MPTESAVTAMAVTLMRDKREPAARDAQRDRARRSESSARAYAHNEYMQLLAGARDRRAPTFTYRGRVYVRDGKQPWIYRRRDDA